MARVIVGSRDIAERYVAAIFQIAVESDNLQVIFQDFSELQDLIVGCNDSLLTIASPVIKIPLKIAIITELASKLKLSEVTTKFLVLLAKNDRFSYLAGIVDVFFSNYNKYKGIKRVLVTTSISVEKSYQGHIVDVLKEVFGDKIEPIFSVDDKIIGGLVVKVESQVYDTSVYSKMRRLEKQSVNQILNMQ